MNKKVLTLCAGFLLAGAASMSAQDLVKITNPDLLLDGETYYLGNADGDSLVTFNAVKSQSYKTVNTAKKDLKKLSSSEVAFVKNGNNWSIEHNGMNIYAWTDGFYTNYPADNVNNSKYKQLMTVTPGENGLITIKSVKGAKGTEQNLQANQFLTREAKGAQAKGYIKAQGDFSSFQLYTKAVTAEGETPIEVADACTFLLFAGNKYVGVKGKSISEVTEALTEKTEALYSWIKEGNAYKNVATGLYLSWNATKNEFATSTTPVTVSMNGTILVVGGVATKTAGTFESQAPLPVQLPGNWADMQVEIKKDDKGNIVDPGKFALFARNNIAITWEKDATSGVYEYGCAIYNAQNATPFTFSLSKEEQSDGSYRVYLMQNGEHVKVNGNWVRLDVSATKDSYGLPNNAIIVLKAGGDFITFDGKTLKAVSTVGQATQFGLGQLQEAYISANSLIARYGDYFTLNISYKDEKGNDIDLTGEFEGQLRPVRKVTYYNGEADYVDAQAETDFMLVNAEGNIIVIDTKEPLHVGNMNIGYAFTTLTPKEWQTAVSKGEEDRYLTSFRMSYKPGNDQATLTEITGISVSNLAGSNTTTLYVGRQKDGENYVLVAAPEANLIDVTFKLNAGNGIAAQEWLTTPSYYTVEMINKDKNHYNYGKVLGLDEDGDIAWVAPENVDLNKPEGQFAIDQNYKFRNRENHASATWILDGELYQVEKNVYAVVHPNWSEGNDTLRITPISTYQSKDGFRRYSASELNAKTYTVAMTQLSNDLNVFENHNDKHRLGLDEENATEWRIEMPTVKLKDVTGDFTRMAADTVKVLTRIQYFADGDWRWTQTSDPESKYYYPNTELQICTYVLKNTDNGEYLNGKDFTESAGNAYYVCNEDKKTATRIAFKEDGDGTVNLVPVYDDYDASKDWEVPVDNDKYDNSKRESEYGYYTASLYLSNQKIIGGTTTATGVLKDTYLYSAPSNDVFTINDASAPTYKKLAQGDKIILSLKSNTENVLVEGPKGGLATISNREAHKDLNPTLYVDTAYVNRVGNYAYQYLLSVRPTRIDTTYQCNLPEEHGVHHADTTKGFFLVNMVDSALANQNVHNNKFMYNGEYKLDFVEAYHTNDSLFFTEEGKVVSKMEVGNGDFNIAKYAFKMVDETENEFVIETASGYTTKKNWVKDNNGNWHWTVASVESKPGYLRWVNDNLVVTDDIDKAAIFTMEASDKEATANENITAGNVVVAGVNGAVVVKGAEGKNVIVSTILGKVVANEVVSSDNATIAAPAGVVVVSVDGESFKVVVK